MESTESTAGDSEIYNGYSVDDEDQPQGFGDSLVDDRGLKDPLDEGYSPPEKWSAAQGFGNTEAEADRGETLDQRLRQEIPDIDPNAPAGDNVGLERAGASAEEAAVHIIEEV